jgi:hypothetical protein
MMCAASAEFAGRRVGMLHVSCDASRDRSAAYQSFVVK